MKLKTKQRRKTRLESVHFDDKGRLDKEKGIVYNAKILGPVSKHGYRYTEPAMKRAIPLYEGVHVNIDHPEKSKAGATRSYRDRFGFWKNVRYEAGDGLRGDFHYNPKHPVGPQFEWDAEHSPGNCAFSHNATGPLTERNGTALCESIEKVRAVDLVANGATNKSLFESDGNMKVRTKKSVRKLKQVAVKRRLMEAFGKKVATQLLEDASPGDAASVAAMVPSGGGGTSDDANVEALIALIRSDLANPNITADDTIKAVTKKLKALKDMIPGGAAPAADPADASDANMESDPDDDEEDEDDDTDPVVKLPAAIEKRLQRFEAFTEKQTVRDLCESLGFRPTDKQMKMLLKTGDEDSQIELIESWDDTVSDRRAAATARKKGKAKSRDMMESESGNSKKPVDSKEWLGGLIDD